MLSQININIVATAQDLILVQNFIYRWKLWKNVIIFGADMSSSVHVDNKGKDILILGERPTQGLDDATLTTETKYSINFYKIK